MCVCVYVYVCMCMCVLLVRGLIIQVDSKKAKYEIDETCVYCYYYYFSCVLFRNNVLLLSRHHLQWRFAVASRTLDRVGVSEE
jgi:hypothetical protein